MSIALESLEELLELLVHDTVIHEVMLVEKEFTRTRELSVQQEISDFLETADFREFFDLVTTVGEDGILTVDESDSTRAGTRRAKAWIESEESCFRVQAPDIHCWDTHHRTQDRQLHSSSVRESQGREFLCFVLLLLLLDT